MRVGVVVPVGPGREENLLSCLESLHHQVPQPEAIVIVHDGPEAFNGQATGNTIPIAQAVLERPHQPGDEQPRNVGVRQLQQMWPFLTHVWFVDSDLIFKPDCFSAYLDGHGAAFGSPERILIGPYDWMPEGEREPHPELHNDPRWPSFSQHGPEEVVTEDLSAGLANFSGNLVWPIDEFISVGGFWNEIHHGRCEDGELGLRAVALGIPMSFVPEARGWHMGHPVNLSLARERNARDVPMLNARHPWVQGEGLSVVPEDGRRFDAHCATCDQDINTIEFWAHRETCGKDPEEGVVMPETMP